MLTIALLLACSGGDDATSGTETDTEAESYELIHTMGDEFGFTLDPDLITHFYLQGNAYSAQSTWILLGDGVTLDDRDEDEPYRITASDDGDWYDFWAWIQEADRDPVAVRLGTDDDSEYTTFTDEALGLEEGWLDGWEVRALDLYKGEWQWDEFENDKVAFSYEIWGVPE